jgi:Tol biopolymer transport system component/predicted Ser/Thr protein kinase
MVEKIGAGGMGEVWRANDPRLDRDVAIKILPPDFATAEQFRARFDREAKTISSLNHPNICTLFDVGEQDGTHFLVMELIEGESLAERLRRDGRFPIERVFEIGGEIASALDAAHRQGIVHRDLKPDNIMLTRSGAKLLDFGLAKVGGPISNDPSSLTSLPTEHGSPLTEAGTILGTFQYMAPEQLEGMEADARTDIFAFGTVLYEMTTGQKAFEGKGRASLIAAIIEREPPPMSSLQALTPPALEHIVSVCLKKDPRDRWQTAHDVKLGLKWIDEAGSAAGIAAPTVVKRKARERLAWAAAGLLLITTIGAGVVAMNRGHTLDARQKVVASIQPPAKARFGTLGSNVGALTLSPDGHWVTFVSDATGGRNMLYIRPLDSAAAQPLAGTESATFPFWSPDSSQIGFFSGGQLKKIDRSGGAAITVTAAQDGRGGTWNRDGVILFAAGTNTGLSRVSAGGGPAVSITELDTAAKETTHRYPVFLPNGKDYLYLQGNHNAPINDESNSIWVGQLDSNERVRLVQSGSNAFFAQGHLFHVRDGFLMAQPLDDRNLKLSGDPFAVAQEVGFLSNYFRAAFAVSKNGIIAFQRGLGRDAQLAWLDRSGNRVGALGGFDQYRFVRLSPDDRKLAVTQVDPSSGTSDIWIFDVSRNVKSRLTFDEANDSHAVWSPDGSEVVFGSRRTGSGDLYKRKANGSGGAELLWGVETPLDPADWSPDGANIAVDYGANSGSDLWIFPVSGNQEPYALVATDFDEGYARFSPDGKWLAYLSNESGNYELYATRFPGGDGKWQISTEGADWLLGWKGDGSEIYFMDLDARISSVKVSLGEELVADIPSVLFPTQTNETWDSSRDGERFILGTPEIKEENFPITLILNWAAGR